MTTRRDGGIPQRREVWGFSPEVMANEVAQTYGRGCLAHLAEARMRTESTAAEFEQFWTEVRAILVARGAK